MKSSTSFLLIVLALAFVSCNNKSDHDFGKLQKMDWLIGNWENKMPDGTLTETWSKLNDSIFEGKSFYIKEKDTIHFETILLKQKAEELMYSTTVAGQDNDEPVDFKLSSETNNTFAFENSTHDYPQKIVYKKINANLFVSTLSGKQQGKASQESYPMKRK